MSAGRKSQDKQPRVRVAKARNRLRPVVPFKIGAPFYLTHFFAMGNQARTAVARNNLLVERENIGLRKVGWRRSIPGNSLAEVTWHLSQFSSLSIHTWSMIAFHQAGQSIKKNFRPIERIHVQLGLIVRSLIIWIQHHGRNMAIMPFGANKPAVRDRYGISNHNGADVAGTQDLECGLNRKDGYHTVSGMR